MLLRELRILPDSRIVRPSRNRLPRTVPALIPQSAELPPPSADAAAHSGRLCETIEGEIDRRGGFLPFARYMELALYAPGLGYYSAGSAKLGAAGDFVTAPEMSPLFGQTLAQQVADLLYADAPDVFELGAGSGKLACDLLSELESLGKLPGRYLILEPSAELRERQRQLIESRAPRHLGRVQWLDALPQRFCGAILANEVLDALPVHLVVWRGGGNGAILERGVVRSPAHRFAWEDRPAAGAVLAAAREIAHTIGDLADGCDYLSEVNLAAPALVASLAASLERGVVLFADYGFPRREFYHPQRSMGTLMCHYRHRSHGDPFFLPGLQDITAHVDFTAVRDAAAGAGLACLGYATQARFLIDCGITGVLSRIPADDAARYLPLAGAAQKLLAPSEMGELFKVIAFGRKFDQPLRGFASGDQRARLG
jgi:SAM-dependent MidA family methyltransferase